MKKGNRHLSDGDVVQILVDYRKDVRPYYELVNAFNIILGSFMYERILGIKKRTRIVLMPKLAFNLAAKRGFRNKIELNLGVFPLVKALVISVSKLNFVCPDILLDKSFDQGKALADFADILNVIYYQIDGYDLKDDHISELLDESDLGIRADFAYSLFKKTLYFLFCHEYTHIRCRHASRIKNKNVIEFQINTEESHDNVDFIRRKHWSELEADHFGANLTIEMLGIFCKSMPGQYKRQISDSEAKEVRQVFLVIGLLFLAFSYRPDEKTSISFYQVYNHPHPCVRLANVCDVMANYISGMYSIDMQSVIDVMSDVLYMLIRIARAVGVKEFDAIITNINEIREEIHNIQNGINKTWVDTSNNAMIETLIAVRKGVAIA